MAHAITAAIPLQAPTPPRVLDELSGQIGKMAPTALNKLDELSGQIGKMAPTACNEYVRDFWERSFCLWTSCASAATSARRCWRTRQLRS